MFMTIGGAAIEMFSTSPPRNSCRCRKKPHVWY